MNSIISITVFLLVFAKEAFLYKGGENSGLYTFYRCQVGIVGGGFSGLYMAYRLLKTGKETQVCIFEKDSTVGGRVRDFRFKQAPDVHVGLGAWRIDKNQDNMLNLVDELGISHTEWTFVKPSLYESRGIKANNFEDLKKGFPSLLAHPVFGNMTREELLSYAFKPKYLAEVDQYATAYSYFSDIITAEGREFLADPSFHRGEFEVFASPQSFIEFYESLAKLSGEYVRPVGGMSAIISHLKREVKEMGGRIFTNIEVQSLKKRRNKYIIKTSKSRVRTKKLIIAITPEQLKKISGSVSRRIQDEDQFDAIQPVPAFKGAAVYDYPWWEGLEVAGTPVQAGQRFISSSNCLGLSMGHRNKGINGEGVLHTMYTDGDCARRWNDIATMDKNFIDAEVHRALETKYGTKIPAPLDTAYQFWDSAWHFQKPGTSFTMVDISDWAKRPLEGEDVFVVGEAYSPFRGWCAGALVTCKNALKEGWDIEMDETEAEMAARSMETKVDLGKLVLSKRIDLL